MLSASQFLKHRVSSLSLLNRSDSESTEGDPDDACRHPQNCNIFSVLVNGATDRMGSFLDDDDDSDDDDDEGEVPSSTTTTGASTTTTMSPTATAPAPSHTPKTPLHSISHCPSFNSVAQALPHSLTPHSLTPHCLSQDNSRRNSADQVCLHEPDVLDPH